jgi:hypothetical protein
MLDAMAQAQEEYNVRNAAMALMIVLEGSTGTSVGP